MVYLLSGCIFLGWLVPNHYFPWLSAWNEATSIVGLLLLSLYSLRTHRSPPKASVLLVAFFGLIFIQPWLQLAAGHLFFAGDAVMVSLYAACALLAICLGHALCCSPAQHSHQGFTALMIACTLAAIASTGVALVQWTNALSLGIYGAELPLGSRPFGNVAQPNHLSTLCFLGICALCWLYEQRQIGKAGWRLGVLFLVCGMLLSQSRTGWLQIGLLVVWGSIQYVRMHNRISLRCLLLLGA
ncbi:pilin glycosylation ligase domain-containing protein, partial [Comamonas aquatica]|uniref:pilin glycosylation ligase domain-containing protein n=1 Tax=Comamonas aquatica TaxID=225991 RepID=UPI0024468A53